MDKEKIKCIYYIKDLRTDTIIYIGQTTDFKERKRCHFGRKSKRYYVDNYMFMEGRENFEIEIFRDIDITVFSDEDIKKKEDELILQYDTINNGYNKQRSGLVSYNKQYKKEQSKEYHKKYYQENRDKLIQYYKEYNKQYYQENKELLREKRKEYYQKHKK